MAGRSWPALRPFLGIVLALVAVLLGAATPPAQAATFTVTKTADTADGACDGDCSLREAITAANAAVGADAITVPAGTYILSIAGSAENANATGDLDITDDVTINGAGAASTIIDGDGVDRVLHVDPADTGVTAGITGLTMEGGDANVGGGIYNLGDATLTNVTFSGNTAGGGGGISNRGTITLINSAVSGNTSGGGGGISNLGTVALTNSTVSGNTTTFDGGGIYNNGAVTLTNSTVSGNTATEEGGGIHNWATATLTNSTVSGNTAATGGGIYNEVTGSATLKNTIVANSTSGGDCLDNATFPFGITSLGYNLDSDNTCNLTDPDDLPNTNPILGPLADGLGPTETHALLSGSPAIDAGTNSGCPAGDQRGVSRPMDGDHDGTATCDMGAYEYGLAHYKAYDAPGLPLSETVTLETEFGTETGVSVTDPLMLAVPSLKNLEGDVEAPHLRCYLTGSSDDPPGTVTLETQFGVEALEVGLSSLMCVPTLKTVTSPYYDVAEGPLPTVPHYKCYTVAGGSDPPDVVHLVTQFGEEPAVEVGPATVLCAPAIKTVESSGLPEGDLNSPYLVCHDIDTDDPEHTVNLETQFGVEEGVEVDPLASGKLCVSGLMVSCLDPDAVPWSTPPGDGDCDGFSTIDENSCGTDPGVACDDGAGLPDWPPDWDDSQTVNLLDLLPFKPHYGAADPLDPLYDARYDLYMDGAINLLDLLPFKPFYNLSCTP